MTPEIQFVGVISRYLAVKGEPHRLRAILSEFCRFSHSFGASFAGTKSVSAIYVKVIDGLDCGL
jgi:hypothetical protein